MPPSPPFAMRRALRDRAPFHRRLDPDSAKIEIRYDLRILDDRVPDREELIELLERRFPWFTISLHETEPTRPWRGGTADVP